PLPVLFRSALSTLCFSLLLFPRPPLSTLFPYTTLFRSARLRDTADVLLKRAAQQRIGHLPMRSGIPLLGEQIRCGLVFGDVIQIGIDFQPVERAANKQGL